jgi:hypothetical protein
MGKVNWTCTLTGASSRYPNVAAAVVPDDVAQKLGGRGRIPIKGTINGFRFRTTICRMKGKMFFCVNAPMRAGAGDVRAGESVRFVLENDNEERTVAIPPDLAAALAKTKGARAAFDAMSYSHRKEHVLAINDAKKPETRARRIATSLQEVLEKAEAKKEKSAKRRALASA